MTTYNKNQYIEVAAKERGNVKELEKVKQVAYLVTSLWRAFHYKECSASKSSQNEISYGEAEDRKELTKFSWTVANLMSTSVLVLNS